MSCPTLSLPHPLPVVVLGPDRRAAAARLVFADGLLTGQLLEIRPLQPCRDTGFAAGAEGDDRGDGSLGIGGVGRFGNGYGHAENRREGYRDRPGEALQHYAPRHGFVRTSCSGLTLRPA